MDAAGSQDSPLDLPLLWIPPSASTTAMGARIFGAFLQRARRRRTENYTLAELFFKGIEEAAFLIERHGSLDQEDLKKYCYNHTFYTIAGIIRPKSILFFMREELAAEDVDLSLEHPRYVAMITAAYLGRLDTLASLRFSSGHDKSTMNPSLVLMAAALGGNTNVVEFLRQNQVCLTSTFTNDSSALHYAAQGGHAETIQYLLEAGVDVDSPNVAA